MTFENLLRNFFGAPLRGQTYANLLYLLLAFPLGLIYFVFLITGLSLGTGLVILWIGLLILLGVFAAWYGLVAFERLQAVALLRVDIPPLAAPETDQPSLLQRLGRMFKNPVTWKGLFFLLAKLPLGLIAFCLLLTFFSVGLALLATPFYYTQIQPIVWDITFNGAPFHPLWRMDTLPQALVVSMVGLFILLIGLQVSNGLAWVAGQFARVMLGNTATRPSGLIPPNQPQAPLGQPVEEAAEA